MENPIKKIRENILSKKLVKLVEDGGPMYFTDPENGKMYAGGSSRYKFKVGDGLSYSPPVIGEKEKYIIIADRVKYLDQVKTLINSGANVNYAGKSGLETTPLDAVSKSNEKLSVEAKVMKAPTKEGFASFKPHFMGEKGASPSQDVAGILLKRGANKLNSEKTFANNFPALADDMKKARTVVAAAQKAALHGKGR